MSLDKEIADQVSEDYKDQPPETTFQVGMSNIKVHTITAPDRSSLEVLSVMALAPWTPNPSEYAKEMALKKQLSGQMPLGNAEEALKFTFLITGISRATTHQLVRTRVGACYSQEGGRNNDWRKHDIRIPRTIEDNIEAMNMFVAAGDYCKKVYVNMVDSGIPYQDARMILPIGTTTYLYETINYRALKGLLANRLCVGMGWEINRVAWLMKDEVEKNIPELAKALVPRCCLVGKCVHEGDIFPPCALYPRKWNKEDYQHPDIWTSNGAFLEGKEIMSRLQECKKDMEEMRDGDK